MTQIRLTIHVIIFLLMSVACVAQSNEEKCSWREAADLLRDEKGKPITISSNELEHRFISGEKPKYPSSCRCLGYAQVLLYIDANGEIACFQIISGHPLFKYSIAQVIKNWRFIPYQTDNGNKSFVALLSYNFNLDARPWGQLNQTLPCKPPHTVLKDSSSKILWLRPNEMLDRTIEKIEPSADAHSRASGGVLVNVMVKENGKITCATTATGHPLLRERAIQAAVKWKFKPYLVNNKPVPFFGHLLFSFPKPNH